MPLYTTPDGAKDGGGEGRRLDALHQVDVKLLRLLGLNWKTVLFKRQQWIQIWLR